MLDHTPESTLLPSAEELTDDAGCIAQVRAGNRAAYDELYRRHHGPAVRAAAAIAGPNLAEEHTAEAFVRVLELLLAGKGPDDHFRPYLIRAIRNIHLNHQRRAARVLLHDSPGEQVRPDLSGDPWEELFDSAAVSVALAALPPRWQQVLWLHTVEHRSVTEISEQLGISAGAVSQLSFRAREALRTEYLAAHLQEPTADACQEVVSRLPQVVRGGSPARAHKVEAHLSTCVPCSARAEEINALSSHMGGTRRRVVPQRRTGFDVRPHAVQVSPTLAR